MLLVCGVSSAGGDVERSLLQGRVLAGERRLRQRPRTRSILRRQQKTCLTGEFGPGVYYRSNCQIVSG